MGGWSARKAIEVVNNIEYVLAIELLVACQALEFYHAKGLKTTEPLEHVYELVRSQIKPWNKDRYMAPDINAAVKLLQENKVWNVVVPYIEEYFKTMNYNNEDISVLLQ